jgi:F-type H+-transporting ATPase subunit gamma
MGAQLREYRARIKSAQTMQKVTSAMELIATSRISKARRRMEESNPYARAVTQAVSAAATYADIDHVLLNEHADVRRAAIVVFTSDRGLNGAFSSGVLKEAEELARLLTDQGKEVTYFLVGRKAVGYFTFRSRSYEQEWTGTSEKPEFGTAREIGKALVERFTADHADGGVQEIHFIYNRFVNMVSQEPTTVRLLPLEVVEGDAEQSGMEDLFPLYDFEPDPATVLDALLPVYIEARLFNAMLHSAASEQAARQRAMKAASDNAQELVRDSTRLANNARQAEITQQISEIVSGADALAS